jgi:Skp family chaperone for outer membrane proteins
MWRSVIVWIAFLSAHGWSQAIPRVAVVDVSAAFVAHPEVKRAEAALEKRRAEARREFDRKAAELKGLLHKHQQLTTRLIAAGERASADEKQQADELLERAAQLEREVTALQTTGERDLEQAFLAERRRVMNLIRQAVAELNSDGTYAVVLDISALSPNGVPQVLHAPGADDLTEAVIRRFNGSR